MRIQLPQQVTYIINELMDHGFEAYAVGGCVRDSILGREPEDWDITTSATPQEVKKLFRRTIDTGILHGTVTVMLDKEGYEVTTYRIDGEYEDSRHPKSVEFTSSLVEDLKRRDFTINAMAYNEAQGMVDAFGGLEDIEKGVLRCVGSAGDRFDEDALRILRAVRFSAQLDFHIEEETLKAAKSKAENLRKISAERIRVELNKLLLSGHPEKLVQAYELGITKIILPEFDAMMETQQHNSHHIYSVGLHIIKAVEEVGSLAAGGKNGIEGPSPLTEKELLILKYTMLLHDCAKPLCRKRGEDGQDHFHGHGEMGVGIAKDVLRRLKFDNETTDTVLRLIKWHDYRFTLTSSGMRKATNKIGEDIMDLLFLVKRADILAQNPVKRDSKLKDLEAAQELFLEMRNRKECVSLKTLNINGKDLLELGFRPGVHLGETLNRLLEEVLERPELNEKSTLLDMAKKYMIP